MLDEIGHIIIESVLFFVEALDFIVLDFEFYLRGGYRW
jgi:hypothetical protein